MKIEIYADVRDHLRAHLSSAALGAAMELGLFWRLAEQPQSAEIIAVRPEMLGVRFINWAADGAFRLSLTV